MHNLLTVENFNFGNMDINFYGEWYVDEKRMSWNYLLNVHFIYNNEIRQAQINKVRKLDNSDFNDLVSYIEFETNSTINFDSLTETRELFLNLVNEHLESAKPETSAHDSYYGI